MNATLGLSPPLSLQRSFTAARAAISSDDVMTARPLLEEIASALPDNLEVRLYAAWARTRLAESVTDGERDAIEALARQTLGGGHSLALPLCILGHAAARRGELRAARGLFRHACAADPSLVDARRGLQLVERRLRRDEVDAPRLVIAIVFVLASVALLLARTAA